MKTRYIKTVTAALFAMTAFCAKAQIPNGGLEFWNTDSSLILRTWDYSPSLAKRVAGKSGGYALNLKNIDQGFDQFTGYANLAGPSFDTGVYHPYFPIAALPDSIRLTYKAKLAADTGVIVLGFTHAAEVLPIFTAQALITNTNDQWTTITFPVNQEFASTFTPDSAWISIEASITNTITAGDNITLDEVVMLNSSGNAIAGLPNNRFETWDLSVVSNPIDWIGSDKLNSFDYPASGTSLMSKSPKGGVNALELHSVLAPSGDTLNGLAYSGNTIEYFDPLSIPSFAISKRYQSLRGWYKGNLLAGDVAVMEINVFAAGLVVGNGFMMQNSLTSTYNFFQADIDYDVNFTGTPDSATIMLSLQNVGEYPVHSFASTVTFDELELSEFAARKNQVRGNVLRLYPNPAVDMVMVSIQNEIGTLYLTDMQGRIIMQKHADGNTQIDVSHIPSGIYSVRFISDKHIYSTLLEIHAH